MVTQGGTLTVTFVNSIDFLNRIKEFEVKYEMNWGEFLAKFTSGKFSTCTEEYSDYTEWAFLCKAFLSDLIQLEGKSPPCKVGTEAGNSEKPELISGFCFLGEQTWPQGLCRDRHQRTLALCRRRSNQIICRKRSRMSTWFTQPSSSPFLSA